jgi:MFS family permease
MPRSNGADLNPTPVPPAPVPSSHVGWSSLRELSRYHWFVFVVCCLAWDLDCMDQQLFVLGRDPAVASLMDLKGGDSRVTAMGAYATAVFMVGWSIGGIGFGILGDRLGRVKTLIWTISLYSLFTGLSALSHSVWDFMAYRLLTGLGVGGAFAAAVVLLAETVPERPRPFILGLFQASSVIGNCGAALVSMYLGSQEQAGLFAGRYLSAWRIMFLIGILPGLLLVVVQFTLKEPERWVLQRKAEAGNEAGSAWSRFFGTLVALLQHPIWGRRAVFGLLLTGAGVVGLWGIGFFSVRLVDNVLRKEFIGSDLPQQVIEGDIKFWKGINSLVQNLGAFFGVFAFSWVTSSLGRRKTFAVFFVLAAVATAGTFLFLNSRRDVFWMIPIMGFCQLALFGGYAIYLPELFPTRFRSTGTSFCYNAGRLLAALGPSMLGLLTDVVYKDFAEPFRYAGVTMSSVFLLGMLALPYLPETKGQPLPE